MSLGQPQLPASPGRGVGVVCAHAVPACVKSPQKLRENDVQMSGPCERRSLNAPDCGKTLWFVRQELRDQPVALRGVTLTAAHDQVGGPIRPAQALGNDMVEFVALLARTSAVSALPTVPVEDVGAKLPLVKSAMLVRFARDLSVLHELGIEYGRLHPDMTDRIERAEPVYPGQRILQTGF